MSVTWNRHAVAGAEGSVVIAEAATGTDVGRLELPGGALSVALSRDAQHLAATGPTGYVLWSRSGGPALMVETGAWSSVAAWADSSRVAVASGRRALVFDATGQKLWTAEPAASTVTDLAWLRDGRRLAVAAYGAVRAHERHTEKPVVTYPYVGSHLALAVAPTGRWICSGNQDASIHIWRTRAASELTISGYRETVSRLAFDDTSHWLAADGAPDVTVWDFSGKGPAGTGPRSLRYHETITAPAWRPDPAGHLASGGNDGTVALWQATAGRPQIRLLPTRTLAGDSGVAALAWSGPHLLITAHRGGHVRAFRLPSATAL